MNALLQSFQNFDALHIISAIAIILLLKQPITQLLDRIHRKKYPHESSAIITTAQRITRVEDTNQTLLAELAKHQTECSASNARIETEIKHLKEQITRLTDLTESIRNRLDSK